MHRTVSLSRMGLDDAGLYRWITERGQHEVQRLRSGPLDGVDVSHNSLTEEGVSFLVDFLRAQRRATMRLSLHHNKLRDTGSICDLIEDRDLGAGAPGGLTELHLSHNSLRPAAVEEVLCSLRRCARSRGCSRCARSRGCSRCASSRGCSRPPFWLRVECNDGVEDFAREWAEEFGRDGLRICMEGAGRSAGCSISHCKRGADVHLNVVDRCRRSGDSKPCQTFALCRRGSGGRERAARGGELQRRSEPQRGGDPQLCGEPKRVELRKGDREIHIVAYHSGAAAASRSRYRSSRERSRSRSPIRIEVRILGGSIANLPQLRAESPEALRNGNAWRLRRCFGRHEEEDSCSRRQDGERHGKMSDSWKAGRKGGRGDQKRGGQEALGWMEGDRQSGSDVAKESSVVGPVTGPLPFMIQLDRQHLDDESLRIRLAEDMRSTVHKQGERPIENFNLSMNRLTDRGVRTVVDFLVEERTPTLRLKFFGNSLREPDFSRLLEDEKLGPGAAEGLQELHLSNNDMTHQGVRDILDSLLERKRRLGQGFNPPLWLRMEHNRRLREATVQDIAKEFEERGLSLCFGCVPAEKRGGGCTLKRCRHHKDVHIFVGLPDQKTKRRRTDSR